MDYTNTQLLVYYDMYKKLCTIICMDAIYMHLDLSK